MLQDLRYTLRGLLSSPRFTLTAVLTLALGIGATTAGFSLANWLILRPLPGVRDDGRLVIVWFGRSGEGSSFTPSWLTYPNRSDLLSMTPAVEALAGYQQLSANIALDGAPARRVTVEYVSADYFSILGVRPRLGRFFTPDEDQPPRGSQLAVISESLWRELFNAEPAALGRSLRVNGIGFAIMGVAPEPFQGADRFAETQIWLPGTTQFLAEHDPRRYDRESGGFYEHFGRLAPEATYEQAREQLRIGARRLAELHPEENEDLADWDPAVASGTGTAPLWRDLMVEKAALLLGLTGLLLTVSIANVATLLLFRGVRRRAELAVRKALGASDSRVTRLCVIESVVLAVAGGTLGLMVAIGVVNLFEGSTLLMARLTEVPLDRRVLGFGATASLGAGVAMGLVPGWFVRRTQVVEGLKQGARTGTDGEAVVRQTLAAAQLATSMVLVVLAVLFVRTLQNLTAVELGFDPNHVTVFHLDPRSQGYRGDRLRLYLAELERRAQELAGVESAALSSGVPFSGGFSRTRIRRMEDEPDRVVDAYFEQVSPPFFETLRLPPLRGGIFTDADSDHGVIVSAGLARRLFGDGDPLGRAVSFHALGEKGRDFRVVGVVGDSRWRDVESEAPSFVYRPDWPERTRVLVVRSPRPTRDIVAAVQALAASLDSSMPLHDAATLRELVGRELSERRAMARLLTLLSGLAVILAAVGLYGLVGYGVETRAREFGIRMALGAERTSIARLAMQQGARLALIGVVTGGAGGGVAARLVESRLFGVTPLDGATFGLAAATLTAAALIACYLPARRAARTDPMVSLRYE